MPCERVLSDFSYICAANSTKKKILFEHSHEQLEHELIVVHPTHTDTDRHTDKYRWMIRRKCDVIARRKIAQIRHTKKIFARTSPHFHRSRARSKPRSTGGGCVSLKRSITRMKFTNYRFLTKNMVVGSGFHPTLRFQHFTMATTHTCELEEIVVIVVNTQRNRNEYPCGVCGEDKKWQHSSTCIAYRAHILCEYANADVLHIVFGMFNAVWWNTQNKNKKKTDYISSTWCGYREYATEHSILHAFIPTFI